MINNDVIKLIAERHLIKISIINYNVINITEGFINVYVLGNDLQMPMHIEIL